MIYETLAGGVLERFQVRTRSRPSQVERQNDDTEIAMVGFVESCLSASRNGLSGRFLFRW